MTQEKNTERETQYELCNQREFTQIQKIENKVKPSCVTKENSRIYPDTKDREQGED
jgi:hypothetical protein